MNHRVVCIGTAVIDTVFAVPHLPLAAGKNFATTVTQVGGGLAANAAVTVTALGGEGVLWSRVGADPAGEHIVRELIDWRIDVAGVQRIEGRRSALSTVLIDTTGERQIVNYLDPLLFAGEAAVPLSELVQANALMVDLRWPAAATAALAEARVHGVPSLVDFERIPEEVHPELIELGSHVVFGEEGLAALAGTQDIAAALGQIATRTNAWLGVTCGAKGVYWLDRGKLRHLPAFAVKVVDTLAAGDVFHGAFALALAEAQPIETALRFATAAAAVKCTRFGGREGIPARPEVEQLLGQHA